MNWMVIMVLEMTLGILGSLITAWFSRQREFRADRGGAMFAGRERMLGALKRLAANRELVDTQHQALATFKINGAKSWMVFFSTHPPIEARIAALERFRDNRPSRDAISYGACIPRSFRPTRSPRTSTAPG